MTCLTILLIVGTVLVVALLAGFPILVVAIVAYFTSAIVVGVANAVVESSKSD